jgi:hypothetical protein
MEWRERGMMGECMEFGVQFWVFLRFLGLFLGSFRVHLSDNYPSSIVASFIPRLRFQQMLLSSNSHRFLSIPR